MKVVDMAVLAIAAMTVAGTVESETRTLDK